MIGWTSPKYHSERREGEGAKEDGNRTLAAIRPTNSTDQLQPIQFTGWQFSYVAIAQSSLQLCLDTIGQTLSTLLCSIAYAHAQTTKTPKVASALFFFFFYLLSLFFLLLLFTVTYYFFGKRDTFAIELLISSRDQWMRTIAWTFGAGTSDSFRSHRLSKQTIEQSGWLSVRNRRQHHPALSLILLHITTTNGQGLTTLFLPTSQPK